MPGPTLIMHAAAWSQAAPSLALTKVRRWDLPGRRWAAVACLLNVAGDILNFGLARAGINNLWVGYISTPTSSVFILLALTAWQTSAVARRMMRFAILAYLAMWIAALLFTEDLRRFSNVAFPLHSLFLLACCVWTLLRLALVDHPFPFIRTDWFWIVGGFAVLIGTAAAAEPLLGIFVARAQIGQAMAVVNFRAGLQLLALIAITTGMLCPVTTDSGPSSSPAR